MNVRQALEDITKEVLAQHEGVFVVEINQRNDNYEFILDGDKPLGIYDISSIAREVNKRADEQMPDASYNLDMSSPGADSPLKLARQFPKHIGREFKVALKDGSSISGKLLSVNDNILNFAYYPDQKARKKGEAESVSMPFEDIQQASIILSFK